MGYVKEPAGIDFIIKGKPLTNKQKQAISAFIKADKAKRRQPKKVTAASKPVAKHRLNIA
ncbi:MAG: hypothetical protein U0T75_14690 [Chitinophagales bacterium]